MKKFKDKSKNPLKGYCERCGHYKWFCTCNTPKHNCKQLQSILDCYKVTNNHDQLVADTKEYYEILRLKNPEEWAQTQLLIWEQNIVEQRIFNTISKNGWIKKK